MPGNGGIACRFDAARGPGSPGVFRNKCLQTSTLRRSRAAPRGGQVVALRPLAAAAPGQTWC